MPTLLKITTGLSAFSEGGFLVALGSYVHEEYGQMHLGVFMGYIITGGAIGIFVFDELIYGCLQTFGKKAGNSVDKFGQEAFSFGMFD